MTCCNLEYIKPRDKAQALNLLAQNSDIIWILAGGTDLMLKCKDNIDFSPILLDICDLSEINKIIFEENELKIGAATTLQCISNTKELEKYAGGKMLIDTVLGMATPQTRTIATIGGNICNASPSGDLIGPLMSLNALVKLESNENEKCVKLSDFFIGPGETILRSNELLTEIIIPDINKYSFARYLKFARTSVDLAIVGVSVSLSMDKNLSCQDASIVLTAVGPTVYHAEEAEQYIINKKLNDDTIAKTAQLAMMSTRAISDLRASADYRKHLVQVLVQRALHSAASEVKKND